MPVRSEGFLPELLFLLAVFWGQWCNCLLFGCPLTRHPRAPKGRCPSPVPQGQVGQGQTVAEEGRGRGSGIREGDRSPGSRPRGRGRGPGSRGMVSGIVVPVETPGSGTGDRGPGSGIEARGTRLSPAHGRGGPAPRGPGGRRPLTVHGRSGSGSPGRGGRTGSPGGVNRTDRRGLAGWRAGTAGSLPLPAAGSSRERTVRYRGRWRCRGDRAGQGGGGRAFCESVGWAPTEVQGPRLRRGAVTYGTFQKQTQTPKR